jgi:regulatory protein
VTSDLVAKLLNKALKLLSYRPRSVAEIRLRLKKLTPDNPKLIDQALAKLTEQDLVNDEEFARWWVEQRKRFRPRGNQALKSELFKKGIDRQLIQAALLTLEEEKQLANKLIDKYGWREQMQIRNHLYRRGFSSETITAVIDGLNLKE